MILLKSCEDPYAYAKGPDFATLRRNDGSGKVFRISPQSYVSD